MTKVRMLVQISGTRNGELWPGRGETVDVPADEAELLIRNGCAEAVGSDLPDNAAALVAWIGSDAERAAVALDAEKARPRARRSVVEAAESVLTEPGE